MTERGAVPDNGIALERREAPGPCAKGPARPGTPTPLKTWVPESRRAHRPIARPVKGASPAPWRFPALHPLVRGETEKGYGHPGRPEKQRRRAAERWLDTGG